MSDKIGTKYPQNTTAIEDLYGWAKNNVLFSCDKVFCSHCCIFWGSEVGNNIYFDRPRVIQQRHSQLFAKKICSNTDLIKEFWIMHFEHRTIENTALPATWLRRVDPQPQNRREHAYFHRQNALLFSSSKCTPIFIVKMHYLVFLILFTPWHLVNNITLFIDNYFATSAYSRRFRVTALIFFRQFSKFECIFAPIVWPMQL